jgi:hypothetical protein
VLVAAECFLEPLFELAKQKLQVGSWRFLEEFDDAWTQILFGLIDRACCGANQQFPSQGSKVTTLYRYKVTQTPFVTLLAFNRSLGLARHSQLRKKKCVGVGQLFDALVQRSPDTVTCTGARPQ